MTASLHDISVSLRVLSGELVSVSNAVRVLSNQIDQITGTTSSDPSVFAVILFNKNGAPVMGQITVPDTVASLDASVTFLDAKGFQTHPDDVPAWSSSDANVANVAAAADGLSATINLVGPGAAVIDVHSVDADGTQIDAQGTVTVTTGEPVSGSVDFALPPSVPA